MGIIYFAAFTTSAFQHRAMFGNDGLSPGLQSSTRRPTPAFDVMESHLGLRRDDDMTLELLSWGGAALALVLTFGDRAFALWAPIPATLWAMYLSLVNLEARVVIGYGWEWETLEVGFLMIFLCPLWPSRDPFPRWHPPPMIVLWLLRWAGPAPLRGTTRRRGF